MITRTEGKSQSVESADTEFIVSPLQFTCFAASAHVRPFFLFVSPFSVLIFRKTSYRSISSWKSDLFKRGNGQAWAKYEV